MATLTTYTQALQHINTQSFGDTLKRIVYAPGNGYAADTYTIELTCAPNQKLFNGYIYALTVNGNPNAIYAKLTHADIADSDRCSLQFVRLHVEAEEIVRAVLAEADTRKAKPAEPEPFDYDAYRQKLDATIAGMKRLGAVTVTWDRHSPFPVWAYRDAPQWREGEGNNP